MGIYSVPTPHLANIFGRYDRDYSRRINHAFLSAMADAMETIGISTLNHDRLVEAKDRLNVYQHIAGPIFNIANESYFIGNADVDLCVGLYAPNARDLSKPKFNEKMVLLAAQRAISGEQKNSIKVVLNSKENKRLADAFHADHFSAYWINQHLHESDLARMMRTTLTVDDHVELHRRQWRIDCTGEVLSIDPARTGSVTIYLGHAAARLSVALAATEGDALAQKIGELWQHSSPTDFHDCKRHIATYRDVPPHCLTSSGLNAVLLFGCAEKKMGAYDELTSNGYTFHHHWPSETLATFGLLSEIPKGHPAFIGEEVHDVAA